MQTLLECCRFVIRVSKIKKVYGSGQTLEKKRGGRAANEGAPASQRAEKARLRRLRSQPYRPQEKAPGKALSLRGPLGSGDPGWAGISFRKRPRGDRKRDIEAAAGRFRTGVIGRDGHGRRRDRKRGP